MSDGLGLEYHYFPTSHWSRVISLVIAEKGLAPKRHHVDIRNNASFEPDYMRLNPRGVVPTLVHDGTPVCNGPTIAAYLDDLAAPRVCPTDPALARWAVVLEEFPLMLLSYAVWVLGKRGERSADILADKVERAEAYARRYPDLAAHYERKQRFFAAFRAEVYDEAHVAREKQRCQGILDDVAAAVGDRPYLGGETWGFADAIALSILWRLADLEQLDDWAHEPSHPLQRYFERLKARASFRAVFEDDPLIS